MDRQRNGFLYGRRWLAPAAFVVLSLVDFCLTWWLLEGRGGADEANPVAARILEDFGWAGVAAFKLICVALVLGVVAYLARRRPHRARLVLRVGCLSLLAVVGYSSALLAGDDFHIWDWQLKREERRQRELLTAMDEQARLRARVQVLVRQLAHGDVTLKEATAQIAFADPKHCEGTVFLHGAFAPLEGEAFLAAYLIQQTGLHVAASPDLARARLRSLSEEFASYDMPLPSLVIAAFQDMDSSPADATERLAQAPTRQVRQAAEQMSPRPFRARRRHAPATTIPPPPSSAFFPTLHARGSGR